ncbi:hypothetical protein TNCV_2566541 [Trichonephila clavipes]|uniref:Uncharacterized protein n=1 Tax=Trichonephila clavipes TaxID=2585209 RepID=A0A8X7BNE4_TRICX|nr:hypothetical protein TNCV_2566541 [Trichonephila clavipes]
MRVKPEVTVGRPRVVKDKERRKLYRLVKNDLSQRSCALLNSQHLTGAQADSPRQCSSKCKCFGTYSSADTVELGTAQQTLLSWASVDQNSLPTTPRKGSETLKLDHK